MSRSSSLSHMQAARLDSFGLVPLGRPVHWSVTMKWSDRIAQGFNPGWVEEKRALKVAPDVWAWLADRRAHNPNTHFGRHFQGAFCDITPRAEALGYSVRPFHGQTLSYQEHPPRQIRFHINPVKTSTDYLLNVAMAELEAKSLTERDFHGT